MWRLPAVIPLLALLAACGDGSQKDPGGTGAPVAASPHEQTTPAPAPPDAFWVPYRDQLKPFLDAPYLEEPLQRRARDTHEALSLLAELHEGRVPPNLLVLAMQLWRKLEVHRQAWERAQAELPAASVDAWRLLLPAYAREALATTRQILQDRLGPSPDTATALARRLAPIEELGFALVAEPPGIFCVERSPGWDELAQAREHARALTALSSAFRRELPLLSSREDEPLALLVLRSMKSYQQILLGRLAPLEIPTRRHAWYDPSRGIIVLVGDAPAQDLFYATARALFDRAAVGAPADPWVRTAWLREGLALWFTNTRRTRDTRNDSWVHEFGILNQDAPMDFVRNVINRRIAAKYLAALAPPEMLTTSYVDLAEGPLSHLWRHSSEESELERAYKEMLLRGFVGIRPRSPPEELPKGRRHALLYAENDVLGWHLFATRALLLVHFLRDFEMDESERVLISLPGEKPVVGRYRSRWNAFLLEALRGRDDIDTFRTTLGLEDPAEFQSLCRLFARYERWITSKMMLGQVTAGGIIPYDRHLNRRGDKTGRPEDDLLPR